MVSEQIRFISFLLCYSHTISLNGIGLSMCKDNLHKTYMDITEA